MPPNHSSKTLTLAVVAGRFAVVRLPPEQAMPAWAWSGVLASATRTETELSIVCADEAVPGTVFTVERGWRALRVAGPLDFSLIGILARLTAPLAEAGASVFALSTFDTDYLLVRATDLERAVGALRAAGHHVDTGC